jgi:mannose-6-phosphate isomerase-like protein (cupin superfamily)
MSAYLKRFDEIPIYSDKGSQNQTCRDIMPAGVVDKVQLGYNILHGPGHTGLGSHTWDQIFVVVKGAGLLWRGEERIRLEKDMIALIPAGTPHDVHVVEGEHIEYVYVNRHAC